MKYRIISGIDYFDSKHGYYLQIKRWGFWCYHCHSGYHLNGPILFESIKEIKEMIKEWEAYNNFQSKIIEVF